MKTKLILTIISLLIIASSCNNSSSEEPLNPNGDSELALLMRQMYDDGMLAKQDIIDGKKISIVIDHAKMLTAKATEPEKAGSNLYKAFASSYLELAEQLNDPNNPNRVETYSNLINTCTACHKEMCPGPLVKIKKMVLE